MGAVAVDVRSEEAATRLLAASSLRETEVRPQVSAAFVGNIATIRGIPLEYTNEDFEKYLRDHRALLAQRRYRWRWTDSASPTPRTTLRCSSPQTLNAQNEFKWVFGAQKSKNE